MPATDGYVFHNGYCVVHNDRCDRVGLIDKQGKWVLKPEYFSINSQYKYWVVNNGKGECVLDSALNTVLPYTDGRVWVSKEYIGVTLSNHVMQRYSLSGSWSMIFISTMFISSHTILMNCAMLLLKAIVK